MRLRRPRRGCGPGLQSRQDHDENDHAQSKSGRRARSPEHASRLGSPVDARGASASPALAGRVAASAAPRQVQALPIRSTARAAPKLSTRSPSAAQRYRQPAARATSPRGQRRCARHSRARPARRPDRHALPDDPASRRPHLGRRQARRVRRAAQRNSRDLRGWGACLRPLPSWNDWVATRVSNPEDSGASRWDGRLSGVT